MANRIEHNSGVLLPGFTAKPRSLKAASLPGVAGDAALLVDPTDVEQIAQAMWLVLSQPALAAQLRAKGLARAAQCTWERTARETIAVYERVVAGNDER